LGALVISVEAVRIIHAYRSRAIDFEELAKRTRDAGLKRRLSDLARTCVAVAEAIERNPGLFEIDQPECGATLH
jgi:hypothetical protein